jgi:hypothetical protein
VAGLYDSHIFISVLDGFDARTGCFHGGLTYCLLQELTTLYQANEGYRAGRNIPDTGTMLQISEAIEARSATGSKCLSTTIYARSFLHRPSMTSKFEMVTIVESQCSLAMSSPERKNAAIFPSFPMPSRATAINLDFFLHFAHALLRTHEHKFLT